jgi:hypothetical protein
VRRGDDLDAMRCETAEDMRCDAVQMQCDAVQMRCVGKESSGGKEFAPVETDLANRGGER